MKIAVVVVWYNPSDICLRNLITYSNYFDNVYIIDNSQKENRDLSKVILNSKYVFFGENLGIAKALNTGCQEAFQDGCEWCMTMDQDSSWSKEEIENYLKCFYELKENDLLIKSFGPNSSEKSDSSSILGSFFHKIMNKKNGRKSLYSYVERVITSGNLINLEEWHSIGGFVEKLFIDEVDSVFCYSLIEDEKKIVQFNSIYMNHILGNPRKHLLPHPSSHNSIRLYYICRNVQYVKQNYSYFYKKFNYSSYIRRIFIQKILSLKIIDLKYMIKGYKDFKINKLGRFDDIYFK